MRQALGCQLASWQLAKPAIDAGRERVDLELLVQDDEPWRFGLLGVARLSDKEATPRSLGEMRGERRQQLALFGVERRLPGARYRARTPHTSPVRVRSARSSSWSPP